MSVNQRFSNLLSSLGITQSELARKLSTSRQTVNNVAQGETQPSLKFITGLLNTYPSLDANWLLTGEGSMWKEGAGDHIHQSNVGAANSNRVNKQVE